MREIFSTHFAVFVDIAHEITTKIDSEIYSKCAFENIVIETRAFSICVAA